MKTQIFSGKAVATVVAGLLGSAPAFATTLDFEGVAPLDFVDSFYNGGTAAFDTSTTGPNYGIYFGAVGNDSSAVVAGPGMNFVGAPSGSHVLAPTDLSAYGLSSIMNSTTGFSNTVSFQYSAKQAVDVNVFSGLNGSGALLGTFHLDNNNLSGCANGIEFCNWSLASLDLGNKVAYSIDFNSLNTVAGIDNLNVAPVPLPAAAWLLLSGLGGLGAFARRKRVAAANA